MSVAELAVRLHDAAAALAVGVGLLKTEAEATHTVRLQQTEQARAILVEVQANVRQLSHSLSDIAPRPNLPSDLQFGLKREAERLGVSVEIDVAGEIGWLPANYAELVWLASREGLRNVRRHSRTAVCRISLNLDSCPFVLRIRDRGRGLAPDARFGEGIRLLREMAEGAGCDLRIASQPGLGAELVLVGPPCARDRESHAMAGSAGSHVTGNP